MLKFAPLAAAALGISAPALAADIRAYDQHAFVAAQKTGRAILVEVHAPWCPICAAQDKVIEKVTASGPHKNLIIFRIDYDSQKPIWRKFGAPGQSTLIAFRGQKETGRISYQTDEQKIRALLASTRR